MAETVNTNQFKNGMHIEIDGGVWRIVAFQHVKPGKGGAFVRTKVKNLDTGAVVDRTFRAGEKFQRMHTEVKSAQYLYDSGDDVVFMEDETYEQFSLPRKSVAEELEFIPPSTSVQILTVDGKPSGLQLPSSIELCRGRDRAGREGRHGLQRDEAGDARDWRNGAGAAVRQHRATASRSTRAKAATSVERRESYPLHVPALVDTTIRLLSQEPLADRMPTADLLRLAELLDGAGFAYLEVSGGGVFDTAVRRGVESPWERIRALKARTKTPLGMALRGRFLVGSRPGRRRLRAPFRSERGRERDRRLPPRGSVERRLQPP